MKSRPRTRKPKKTFRVLLMDDEKEYLHELKRTHPEFQFDYSNSINDPCKELEARQASGEWPDILLLDVYWPKFGDPKRVQASRVKTDRILKKEVHPAIERMNKAYLRAFEKWGTRALREIRKRFSASDLPIIMYSSKGHFLLRDATQDWLSEAIEYGAN